MTKKQQKALCKYVRWVANEIGLRDWTINVRVEEPAPPREGIPDNINRIATCEPTPHRKLAYLTFAPWLIDISKDESKQTVLHELIHCHFAATQHLPRVMLHGELGQQAYNIFYDAFEQQMEYCIDAIATEWANSLPYIDWEDA